MTASLSVSLEDEVYRGCFISGKQLNSWPSNVFNPILWDGIGLNNFVIRDKGARSDGKSTEADFHYIGQGSNGPLS